MMRRLRMCLGTGWQLLRVFLQTMYGVYRISKLHTPIVSIFGGARFEGTDVYFEKAFELGRQLAKSNISVLTGGGPGIMQAASCGVDALPQGKTLIMGIGVTDLGEKPNQCVQEYFTLDFFFARKWLLTHFSAAFVVFPGGFGTLDELAAVLTLIQTNKIKRVPIILFGVEYWHHFMKWLEDEAIKHGTIDEQDLKLFRITDDLHEVFCLVTDECKVKQ